VFALWGVLALPAVETLVRGRGEEFSLDPVRSWFLMGLIILSVINHLPTRFVAAALLFGAAQLVIFWAYLPWGGFYVFHAWRWIPSALVLASLFCVQTAAKPRLPRVPVIDECPDLRAWSLVWRDFRDYFGTVWSVRIMERVNAQAAMCGWPIRLAWDGLSGNRPTVPQIAAPGDAPYVGRSDADRSPPSVTPQQLSAIEKSLRTLLRRFVSTEWIDQRLRSVQ
jgi:hypothetical protein